MNVSRSGPPRPRRLDVDRWQVGQLRCPERLLDLGAELEVDWFPNPRSNAWLGDPMPLGEDRILCEEFAYLRASGRLVEYATHGGRLTGRRVVEGLTGHASYPWLVDEGDHLYLVPEQSHRPGVWAYRYGRILGDPVCLIPDVRALDTTIVLHQEQWYAFFSTATGGPMGTDLQVWSAPGLLGPWHRLPHRPATTEPVLRPAGSPFVVAGNLVRPSQDCTRTYGGGVRLNLVDRLDPGGFSEHPVATVVLADGPPGGGVHTISILERRAFVDAKRRVLRVDALVGRGRRRAGRLVRRMAP